MFDNLMMILGVKRGSFHLKVDAEGRVRTKHDYQDVLLRKRA